MTMSGLRVNATVVIPESELVEAFVRSGGPGGQNVNKVASKVELRWRPGESQALSQAQRARVVRKLATRLTTAGELIVTSERTRDQARNRDDARARLAAMVRAALARPKTRRPTKPTRASRERRLAGKRQRASVKQQRRAPED
jgi:ribosome-associated protein